MKTASNNLELAAQVLQEQLILLSDPKTDTEVDLKSTKTIIDVTKQIVDVEKLQHSKEELKFEKAQFVHTICEQVSEGKLRYMPVEFQNQVKLIE